LRIVCRHGPCEYTWFNGERLRCVWDNGKCPEWFKKDREIRSNVWHQHGRFGGHASPGGRESSSIHAVAASASSTAAKEHFEQGERIQISDGSEDAASFSSGNGVRNVAVELDFDSIGDVRHDGRSNNHTAAHTPAPAAAPFAISTDMPLESDASSAAVAYNPFASAFATIQPFWLEET
jgi:hypothetical protein